MKGTSGQFTIDPRKRKMDNKKQLETWKKKLVELKGKADKNRLIKYCILIVLLILILGVIFVLKPEITGYVTLTQEKTYADDLNLIINKSGNYNWTIDKVGDIQSIKASGRIKGNGTVKIYIEKDGKLYLIYDNKESE